MFENGARQKAGPPDDGHYHNGYSRPAYYLGTSVEKSKGG
jgi:hypothetical protein